jgi:hypothetical protein
MIRTYDNDTTVVLDRPAATTDVCPDCAGSGVRAHRVFGHNAPEPFVWDTCAACSGTGVVSADGVVHCTRPGCDAVCWADQVCTHTGEDAVCPDCAPHRCRECIDEHGGLDR